MMARYDNPLMVENEPDRGEGLVGGLVGQGDNEWMLPGSEEQGPASDWAVPSGRGDAGGKELQSALQSLLNSGDGWTGPGTAAEVGQPNYTPGLGWSPAGTQAPVDQWNYTPRMSTGTESDQQGAGGQGGNDQQQGLAETSGGTPADFSVPDLPSDYAFSGSTVRASGDPQQTFLDALAYIYEQYGDAIDARFAKTDDDGDDDSWKDAWVGKSWRDKTIDWLQTTDTYFLDRYTWSEDNAIAYAKTLGWEYDDDQQAAKQTPITANVIYFRPRISGDIYQIAAKHGIDPYGLYKVGDWYLARIGGGYEWDLADELSRDPAVAYATPRLEPTDVSWDGLPETSRAYQSWLYLHSGDDEVWNYGDLTVGPDYGGGSVNWLWPTDMD